MIQPPELKLNLPMEVGHGSTLHQTVYSGLFESAANECIGLNIAASVVTI